MVETLGSRLFRGHEKKTSLGQRLFRPQTMVVDGEEEALPEFSSRGQTGFTPVEEELLQAEGHAALGRGIENVLRPVRGAVAGVEGIVGGAAELTGTEPAFLTSERLQKAQSRLAPPAEGTFQQVLEGLGQTAPLMAAGAVSLPAAAGMGALQHGFGAYQNTLQATGKEEEARRALVLNLPVGLMEAVLPGVSRLPGARTVLSRLAPVLQGVEKRSGGALSRAVLGAGAEAGTEGVQRILENAIAQHATSEERALWDGVTQESAVGGWVGGLLNLALGRRAPKTRLEESLERSEAVGRGGALEVPGQEAPPGTTPQGGPAKDITPPKEIATPPDIEPDPVYEQAYEAALERGVGHREANRMAMRASEEASFAAETERLKAEGVLFPEVAQAEPPEARTPLITNIPQGAERGVTQPVYSDPGFLERPFLESPKEAPAPSTQAEPAKTSAPISSLPEGAGKISEQEVPETVPAEEIPEALPPERAAREELLSFPPPLLSRKGEKPQPPPEVNQGFDLPDETLLRRAQRIAQDSLNRIRQIQGVVEMQGGRVEESSDIAERADLFSGRMEEHQRRLKEEILQPLVQTAGRGDISLDDIDEFLVARHAKQRNEIIAGRTKGKLDFGSGMTDEQAEAVLAKHAANPRMQRIGQIVDVMNRETRRVLVEGGIISKETDKAWTEMFGPHYVPLKTAVEGQREGSGRGFSVPRGPFSKRAKGRRSMADSALTFSVLQYEQAALQAERNRVGQAALKFVEDNPDPNQWRVYDPDKRPKDLPILVPERTITVKVAGEPKVIEFADPLLARGLLNLGRSRGGKLIEAMGVAARVYSRLQTSWNPEFVASNVMRDAQTAGINIAAEDSAGFAKRVVNPKSLYKAVRGIARVMRDPKATGEYEDAFRAMRKAGGKVGWYHHKDYAQRFQEIEAELSSLEGEGALRKGWRALKRLGDVIDDMNSAVENGVRLSAFLEAKKRGASEQQAATFSRNLTVDFNKRGEWGAGLNAFWVFYNASVQGSVRLLKAMGTRRGAKLGAGIAAFGALNAWLNYALGGDDEDGVPFYDKIPEHTRASNLVFLIPGWLDEDGAPKHVKIPMPYGYRFLHTLGRKPVEVALGTQKAGAASKDLVMAAVANFSPIGTESSLTQVASPTVLDPMVQISENKTWDGRPIYPPAAYDPYPKPDSQRYFQSVSETSKKIAEVVNDITGGDEFTPGLMDVSPETLDHLLEYVTGGSGRTFRRVVDVTNQIARGEKVETYQVPFWRQLVGEHYEAFDRDRFYAHLDEMKILEERMRRAKGGSLSNKDTPESRELLNENRAAWRMRDEYYRKVGGQPSLQDRLKQAKEAKDEKAETQIYLDFNKRWRKATGRTP